jgi:oxalate decarboxylase/phosphoglucose isomerase-like protein (cupin superfamily)
MIKTVTYKDLKPVLMEGYGKRVNTPYYVIEDTNQILFVVSSGKNGIEFNKTTGYFCRFPGVQTYLCLYGSGILLMQRNDEEEEAKEFKVVTLNPGRQTFVPAGWAMCLVNTGNSFLVVLRGSKLDEKDLDLKSVIAKSGLAYFVVEKKGEIVFEQNPSYKLHPQIATE